jgi:hypothetical protein
LQALLAASVPIPIEINATPTFAVFVMGLGSVPFDRANNRIFSYSYSGSRVRRGTGVAVRATP